MLRRLVLALILSVAVGPTLAISAPEPPEHAVRAAVNRAIPLLEKGSEGYTRQRGCFSCHHQALPVLALSLAKERGFAVDADNLRRQLEFTESSLRGGRENYRQGKGQGGQVDTAGYALLTLDAGAWKADNEGAQTTAAVAEYLLSRNGDLDHWRVTSNRPPSEASDFTTTYLALRGLKAFGTSEQQPRIAARVAAVREWLLKTPPASTEDRVFRLWALKVADAPETAIVAALEELRKAQREDGGWSQIEGMESDAYATGSALLALHQAGRVRVDDPAYRRGLGFLIKTQLPDGSWHVVSRSRPFQAYFESGFPHGDDQFISCAATGWAVAALAASVTR